MSMWELLNKNKIYVLVLVVFLFGVLCGYNAKKEQLVKPAIIMANPVVTTVATDIDVPRWRDRYIRQVVTVNNTVIEQIIITTTNAVTVAVLVQDDLSQFETASLNVMIDPYIIKDNKYPEELNMHAKLSYRTWALKITNNFQTIQQAQPEIKDTPIMLGASYCVNKQFAEISLSKKIAEVPFINLPLTVGISYALGGQN